MPVFLDTTGQPTLGIGICDRCKLKAPLAELVSDPQRPGLRVHEHCKDQFDPWRLPPRQPENIALPFVRPDEPLLVPGAGALPNTARLIIINGRHYWDI